MFQRKVALWLSQYLTTHQKSLLHHSIREYRYIGGLTSRITSWLPGTYARLKGCEHLQSTRQHLLLERAQFTGRYISAPPKLENRAFLLQHREEEIHAQVKRSQRNTPWRWHDLTSFRSELTISFHMRVSVFLMDTYHDSTAFIWNLQQQILFNGYQLKLSTKIYYVIKPITRREIRYGETQYAVNWNRYCDAVPRADNLYATRTYIYLRTEIKK